MTDATKASLLLAVLMSAALGGGAWAAWERREKRRALRVATEQTGVAHAALQAEAQAKAEKAAAHQLAQQQTARVAELERWVAQHPVPPPAQPVPADAPLAVVVAGLQGLGLHPEPLGEGLALSLPDSRTTLTWGREAQRVPLFTTRVQALEDLTAAQRDQAAALEARQAATDRALTAADARADAQQRRAEALQRAYDLTPRWRPTGVGLIGGLDEGGRRHVGAIVSHSWGPVEVGALYLNRNVGVSAVYRF
jgi:hypothetical protein